MKKLALVLARIVWLGILTGMPMAMTGCVVPAPPPVPGPMVVPAPFAPHPPEPVLPPSGPVLPPQPGPGLRPPHP
jgi:hypothetical protein